jgi:osmotically-inducible protein OsmY
MTPQNLIASLLIAGATFAGGAVAQDRTAGQTLDDATITAKVKMEIARTQGLAEAASVNVDTYRRQVSLAGFVDNEELKRAAEQAAQRVEGVEKVVNNLQVKKQ